MDSNRKDSIKKMMTILIITLLFMTSSIILYTNLIKQIKESHTEVINTMQEQEFDQLYIFLLDLKDHAQHHVKMIAIDTEEEIRDTLNLDDLQTDLEQSIYTDELSEIFKSNIKGKYLNDIEDHFNGTFVVSGDFTILEDYNTGRINKAKTTDQWSLYNEAEEAYNKGLCLNALKKMKDHSTQLICMEVTKSENLDHIKIEEADYDTLKNVYVKEGIEGFKNYQFLVPAYITDTGDIFGQQDIVKGKINKTYKFIIIQEFNLYTQFLKSHPEFSEKNNLKVITNDHITTLNYLYILGIAIVIGIISMIFYFVLMYNNFIHGYEKAIENQKDEAL